MGFWHTGYFEHHEQDGLGEWQPARTIFRCQQCEARFDAFDALRQHRFEEHPYVRPVLFVRGIELGASQFHVNRQVTASDFEIGNCEKCRLNGHEMRHGQLAKRLATMTDDRVNVELVNAGVTATYDIDFKIASEQDLDGVDACFLRLANLRVLSVQSVDAFIEESRQFQTATLYLDGIANYLYGVLAKERAPDSSLPADAYRDRFGAAAAALSDYDRHLAHLIRGLIAFHFNHFVDAATEAPQGRLRAAAQRFSDAIRGAGWKAPIGTPTTIHAPEELLTDNEAHQILRWSEAPIDQLARDVEVIAAMARRDELAFGLLKLKVLLIAAYEAKGETASAIKVARTLHNYPETTGTADRIIGRVEAGASA